MIQENVHYERITHKVYKYRCIKPFKNYTRLKGYHLEHEYFTLYSDGVLIIKWGYCSDGVSGPTVDDDTNIQAAFLHDALYQMLRLGLIGKDSKQFKRDRKLADLSFYYQLKRDGMPYIRRWYYYWAVRIFGKKHATPSAMQ